MRVVQDIVFGITGQTLYFDCPEGRPSSVTSVAVYAWDVGDNALAEVAAGAGSVETGPNTTVDAASGWGQANPNVVNVAATTSFVADRSYLLTGADGFREWIDIAEIDSGNSVTALHPLHNAYASGDTVQSTRIQSSIDSTWVANINKLRTDAGPNPHYRVRWVYVVAGVTHVADSYFNLVRYAGTHGVLPQNVASLAPGWMDGLPTDYWANQGRALIDNAYTAVKFDLHAIWDDDSMMANSEIVDELTRYKTIELGEFAKVLSGNGDSVQYQVARDAYRTRFDSLSRITNKTPIRNVSGAASNKPAIGLSRR
jgi:hypothetical protein